MQVSLSGVCVCGVAALCLVALTETETVPVISVCFITGSKEQTPSCCSVFFLLIKGTA